MKVTLFKAAYLIYLIYLLDCTHGRKISMNFDQSLKTHHIFREKLVSLV